MGVTAFDRGAKWEGKGAENVFIYQASCGVLGNNIVMNGVVNSLAFGEGLELWRIIK